MRPRVCAVGATGPTLSSKRERPTRWAARLRRAGVAAFICLASLVIASPPLALASGPHLGRRATATAPRRGCSKEPNFVGMTFAATEALVRRCHYQPLFAYRFPDPHPAGTVVAQSLGSGRVVVSTGPLGDKWSVLLGASSRPVAAECDVTVSLGEDGSAGPVTCGARHVNVEAWDYYALVRPPVMSLPRHASMCYVAGYIAITQVTTPIDIEVAEIARAYNGWSIPDALIAHIFAVGPPYPDHCTPFTATVGAAPVDRAGRVAYGYLTAQTLHGSCTSGSVVEGAGYTCSSHKRYFYACWSGHRRPTGAAQAVCLGDPWSMRATVIVTSKLPAARHGQQGLPWGLETRSDQFCELVGHKPARYRGQTVAYNCDQPWQQPTPGLGLLSDLDERAQLWEVPSVRVSRAGYVAGPRENIVGAWFAAPYQGPGRSGFVRDSVKDAGPWWVDVPRAL